MILPLSNETDAPGIAPLLGAHKVAVVIPCFRVANQVMDVLKKIGPEVHAIYCVDDSCPQATGETISARCSDPRVSVLFNHRNLGVGGAMITGFKQALKDGADIIIKVDGDGQMDPAMIPRFIAPILARRADYTKGNRFFKLESLREMPKVRLFGNSVLSFLTKLSSGYWQIMDPTNGYIAIHFRVLSELPLEKINTGYFFESDLLFRLNTLGAVVEEVPMDARYGEAPTSMKIAKIWFNFLIHNLSNAGKRVFYNHFLRNFSIASVELALAIVFLSFGFIFGLNRWIYSVQSSMPVTSGTVMLAGLPIIVGTQLLLSFLSFDMKNIPQVPLQRRL